MTEGTPQLTLLEGDEDQLVTIDADIKRLEKVRSVVTSEGWKGVLSAIETEKHRIIESLSDPTRLEFKAGMLQGLRLVQDYTTNSEKMLSFLYGQRSDLVALALKNAKEKQDGE